MADEGLWDEAASDFMGTSYTGYQGARQADGSIPNIPLMNLAAGSPRIDKETDGGLPFTGAAPDLGPSYEFGLSTSTASGGGSGASGCGAGGTTGGASGGAAGRLQLHVRCRRRRCGAGRDRNVDRARGGLWR